MNDPLRRLPSMAWLPLFAVLFGCAAAERQEPALIGKDTGKIRVEARSFAFEPSLIRVNKGHSVELHVENVSDTRHNITVKDPHGGVMANVDLPPHQTETIRLRFDEAGTFEFFCDKPFHPMLGMKGRLEVIR